MSDEQNAEDIFFPEPVEPEAEAADAPEADPIEVAAGEADEPETLEADDAEESAEETQEEDDTPVDATEEDEGAGEVFTVKVDGEEIEVGLEELLGGYQRNKDYTQKQQAAAQLQRERDAEYQGKIGELTQALQMYAVPETGEPNPADYVGNADQFVQDHTAWKAQEARQAEAANLLNHITAEENARLVTQERDLLLKAVPEWSDPEAMKAEYEEMATLAVDHWGFTQDELNETKDHRMILLLRDAVRGRKVAQKPVVLSRSKAVQPKLGAGSKVKTDAASAKKKAAVAQLRTTGDTDDPEAIFFNHH